MIYTKLTKTAMIIAYEKHLNQVDKSGVPYIYHPMHLAEQMTTEIEVCVALLHDVVEDTNTTFDDLKEAGFNDSIIEALMLLTHNDDTPYMEYVKKIKTNPTARKVKLADLKHNTLLTRLDESSSKVPYKYDTYLEAIKFLEK